MSFTRLSVLLTNSLRRHGVEQEVTARQVLADATAILDQVAGRPGRARGFRFVRGVLTVQVDHPATAEVVKFRERELFAAMHKKFPNLQLVGLRFTTRP